ncbi:polysaccharide deacetylase family protein [Aquibacillus halophilus]|uniref:Polysaccharide deacetylase family protein n=1 Tax=Aquibacillus halophilus TaxID=930132 RepID=A0A6A8D9I1_9BACI|nr:polysaccharide deacetylase family protein [Aquibacillus halophilus]MRH41920.1 polysaccharide deacetylase family protein [Aquibacillus halophilus]
MNKPNIINDVQTSQKQVALTFDDGPNPLYTSQLLEIFRKVDGKATFFMIGEEMIKHPEVVKAVSENLHEIGNHTYSHPKLTELSSDDCFNELVKTENLIKEMTGKKPTTFRPPYLDYNQDTATVVEEFEYSVIGALNMEAQDWEQPGVEHILSKSLKHVKNGSILIFHDGYGDRSQTIEAVRNLVTEIDNQGYQFVTVSELLRLSRSNNS